MSPTPFAVLMTVLTAAVVVAVFLVLWTRAYEFRTRLVAVLSGAVLAGWALATAMLAKTGFYVQRDLGSPPRTGVQFLLALVLLGAALSISPTLRRLLTNQRQLILLHVWRLVGFIFLALLVAGQVPALWAIPTGIGDVLIGLTAPWIASTLDAPGGKRRAMTFNLLGLADLFVAVGLGVTTSTGPLQLFHTQPPSTLVTMFPLALVPGFLVPLAIALHVVSLWQLSGRAWLRARDLSFAASD